MLRGLALLSLALVALVAVLVARAWSSPSRARPLPALRGLRIDREHAARALAEYVRLDTSAPPGIPRRPRPPHVELLLERYARPLGLAAEVLDERVLVLRWRAPHPAGRPLLLLGHADVVPVADDERPRWRHPPFAGVIAGGHVWGRGTLDDKGSTICALEAVAVLRAAGLAPRRDVLLVVGPDEELGGHEGIGPFVAAHLERLGRPALAIDEGGAIVPDVLPGIELAAVAVGEKRYVTVRLRVDAEAGHASQPTPEVATHVLSRALGRLASTRRGTRRSPVLDAMLERAADRAPLVRRVALRNLWLFGPLVERTISASAAGAASLRDTWAVTVLRAGLKDNVIPRRAEALVNLRLLPGSSRAEVLADLRRVLDEPRVRVEVLSDLRDTPVAPYAGPTWDRLESALGAALPEVLVAPTLTPGTTDGRWLARRGIPTYRFVPFRLDAHERAGIHGVNERVSLENLERAIRTYAHLMRYL